MDTPLLEITPECNIIIHQGIYNITDEPIKVGNYLLDRKDGMWGVCYMIFPGGERIGIATGYCAELGVPIERVYNLKEQL